MANSSKYPENSGSPLVSNVVYENMIQDGVNYVDPDVENILKGGGSTQKSTTPQISDDLLLKDIAQSHHFTVYIDGMKNMSELVTPTGTFSKFLPVKSMSLKYTSYENMSIPVAIFGDFPLLNKKRVSTIDLTCFDFDNNELEYELRKWEAQCFPKGRYVAYMEDVAREFVYRGYSVEGKQTLEYRVFVIPAGNVTVSRDYSANEAKMVTFSVAIVGDGKTCASGSGKVPVQDNGGGVGGVGSYAVPYISGYSLNYAKGKEFIQVI